MKKEAFTGEDLQVIGAREHNLHDISVTIPRNTFTVITGLSGSGKSSLAFDTIYAEGQRRYIETFSAYARQFLGSMERPDVDQITGLSPVISIEQKTVNRSPRSTVGTITEIYDFLRLLFARAGEAYSYVSGEKMVRYSDDQIVRLILEKNKSQQVLLLAPVVKGRKGHYRELFEQVRKQGYVRVRVDGEVRPLSESIKLDRYKVHDIEIVIDRIDVAAKSRQRISESLQTAMKLGKGVIMLLPAQEGNKAEPSFFSRSLMCPSSGISYDDPAPNLFSFNSPYGACPQCNGLGKVSEIDLKKIIPDPSLSIGKGGIAPLKDTRNNWVLSQLEAIGKKYNFTLKTPLGEISEEAIGAILYGTDEVINVKSEALGLTRSYPVKWEGVVNALLRQQEDRQMNPGLQRWIQGFMNRIPCPKCEGARLKKQSLYFRIDGKNISELAGMDISSLRAWCEGLEERMDGRQQAIAHEVLKEIRSRLNFLLDVGLDYLTLNRSARSLSGGEAQRIRLATQIGSQLTGVLYILDEPSIGLHQRDNLRLINSLKELRDVGNSVIVVEHDKETIESADHVVDIGPMAGIHGGRIVAEGPPAELKKFHSLTTEYLTGGLAIEVPEKRRKGNGKTLILEGATGNNLKNITVDFPLGTFICITGVSGSGKSTLINETLYPILNQHFYRSQKKPLPHSGISGLKHLDKVIEIDQSPIGRTPRSNPATYTGVFTDIRDLFAHLPEAKVRGYKPGRFSFNVVGGRCNTCRGAGLRTIEMNFLPDVYVHCETCNGRRYNRETLEVRYKGKSITDVLDLTIDQAVEFFAQIPSIVRKIQTLADVGLGYITLGQSSPTLSGGEAQRVKLATELSKRGTGSTFYILDEPTTGLHFEDCRVLLEVLGKLVNQGNTVVVIEHNMDIIKMADHLVDLGPEGGQRGGQVVCTGTPEEVARHKHSYTGEFLKKELAVGSKQ